MSSCAHGVDEQRCVECNPVLDEEHVDVDLGNRTVTVVVRRRIVDDDTIDERYYIDGRLVVQRKAFRRPQKVWRAAKSGDGVIYAQ